ncbi:MAG: glycosyltransferase [Ignavibacteria bacterium]|nr:glycosyltransferase [Ignavibacteria bacterium]
MNNNLGRLSNFKPFMDPNEITAITIVLRSFEKPIHVLEWGSGNSTIYYSLMFENRNKWLSIEHDREWAERNKEEIRKLSLDNTEVAFIKTNLSYIEGKDDGDIDTFFDYVKYPAKLKLNYDVIFVDGRARVLCMEEGWKMLKPDGVMILHDAQRKEYGIGIPEEAFLLRITNTKVNSEGNIAVLFMSRSSQLLKEIAAGFLHQLPEYIIISTRLNGCEWEHYRGNRKEDNFTEVNSADQSKYAFIDNPVLQKVADESSPGIRQIKDKLFQNENKLIKPGIQSNKQEPSGDQEKDNFNLQSNNSIVFLGTYYGTFLQKHYIKNPELKTASYHKQINSLFSECFGDSDFYSEGLRANGWEVNEIIANCSQLQQAWAKENNFHGSDLEISIQQIKKTSPEVVYIQDMNYFPLDYLQAIKPFTKLIVGQIATPIVNKIPFEFYDIVFSSFPHYVKLFRNSGITAYYQPLAFERRILTRLGENPERNIDLSFVGGISNLHKASYLLLEEFAKNTPIQFWGYGAETLHPSSLIRQCHNGPAWGIEMFQIISSSKITINRHGEVAENFANNMRLFEATGCGALLITDYKDNLNDLFEVGKEVVAYRSVDEAIALAKYYLQHPDEAAGIAKAGQKRTLTEHTYLLRMTQTSEILERHLCYKNCILKAPEMDKISYGYSALKESDVTEKMTSAWKDDSIPEKQRALVQQELKEMYAGKAPKPFTVLADLLNPYMGNKASILEIGCASGYYYEILEYLLNRRIKYTGVDYSNALIEMAKKIYPKVPFYEADGAAMPFDDLSFDVSISSCILLHVPNYKEHIKETARLTKKYIIAHRTPVCKKRSNQLQKKYAYGIETMELIFNEQDFLDEFRKNNFHLIDKNEYYSNSAADEYQVSYVFKRG